MEQKLLNYALCLLFFKPFTYFPIFERKLNKNIEKCQIQKVFREK